MPVKHCCYGLCRSDSRYLNGSSSGIFFIPFPKTKLTRAKCKRWVSLCGRKEFTVEKVRKETYICSLHFVGGNGPTKENPDPMPALSTAPPPKARNPRKRLRLEEEEPLQELHVNILPPPEPSEQEMLTPQPSDQFHDYCEVSVKNDSLGGNMTANASTQTEINMEDMNEYADIEIKNPKVMKRNEFIQTVQKDDDNCKFYTGLTTSVFAVILKLLMAKVHNLNYWRGSDTSGLTGDNPTMRRRGRSRVLTVTEELILTLVRLRRGFDSEVLAYLFQIDNSSLSRIFTTWISFKYHELQFLVSWPSREQVKASLPKCFKTFPKTRVIIDCTEFFIQKPSLASSQRVTWSQYKHHNTAKSLVAVSPSGTFVFVSNLYTGSISDRKIVQQSGFLDKLEYGDDIMADRGFLIRDLLTKKMCTLNIPPFSMGKQLTSKAVAKTRRIASSRIHVERAIGRMKNLSFYNNNSMNCQNY